MEETNPVGRPTLYTKQTCDFICARVAEGYSLRTICSDPAMPARSTIILWQSTYPEFSVQYEAAYKIQMLGVFDELLDLVDQCDVDQIAKVREQVSVRKWVLKIHEPKRFGDHPEPVVQEVAPVEDLNVLTVEERAELLRLKRKMNGQ